MSGRLENQQNIRESILNKLDGTPELLQDYYYRLNYSRSEVSKRVYINSILAFLRFIGGVDNLSKVTTNTITRYQDYIDQEKIKKSGKKLEARSIRTKMAALNSFFNFCVDEGVMKINPMDKYSLPLMPETDNMVVAMTQNEIQQVFAAIERGVGNEKQRKRAKFWKERDKTIMLLALTLGLRLQALVEIDVEDIDFYRAEIHVVEKRDKRRVLYLGHKPITQLKKWMKVREEMLGGEKISALFITKYGGRYKRITPRSVEYMVEKYTSMIDKHITPHKLRSTAATALYNETGNLYMVSDLLGHKNVSTSSIYASNTESSKREVAQMMSDFIDG